ncbi:MAG: putative DNA binding domain-containing protein [Bacteroidaceae bacterium]|nr:putative DNA binding domain-containing protein [Bacteroidaceae bacterium]
MTKEELLQKLIEIEWDDFECKTAQDKLPEDVWTTVSAFSNTSGGWIVFGVKQHGKQFEIQGVNNGEKTESDFLNTLRNGQKFNMRLSAKGQKFNFDGKIVLAFFVPSSIIKPIYFGNPINTFIRTGSGDRRATESEVMAMMRDQAFGSKSEQVVDDTSLDDLNMSSLETYRNHIRSDNPTFPYKDLPNDQFCEKVGISKEGKLTIGGILMLGQRDVVQRYVSNFWIDYLEIPGKSLADAQVRYTFRMQEQDNIWESYQIILQRLRNYVDAPYRARPDGVGVEDESQLYALREGLTNCCAHADYFSPMHPTIRVFTDRIELQNPGRFMFPLSELRTQIHSIPRNPNIIKLFRYAKLGENAGYGIDKMLAWERLTRGKVEFSSDLVSSTITYWFGDQVSGQAEVQARVQAGGQPSEQPSEQAGEQPSEQVQQLINTIRENVLTMFDIQVRLKIRSRSFVQMKLLRPAVEGGYVLRAYPDKPNHPNQRYYLSEKGLKLVK